MYGGRISSILLNIPGDEPAMMTTLDGYPMAKQGRAGDALVLSGVASLRRRDSGDHRADAAGAAAGAASPICSARPSISRSTCWRSAPLAASPRTTRPRRRSRPASASAIAMIGLDNNSGMPRFTYGNMHLMDGVDFLVAIVGLFAIAEVFFFIESHGKDSRHRGQARQGHRSVAATSSTAAGRCCARRSSASSPVSCRAPAPRWARSWPI